MKHLLLVPIAFLGLLAASCQKESANNYVVSGPYKSVDDVFAEAAQTSVRSSVSVSAGGSVRAQGGSRFIIPANAFMDENWQAVTGSVDVEVKDWLMHGDMIFGKVLPIDGQGKPLETGGQVWIRVSQNNRPLTMKPGMSIEVAVPQFGTPATGMQPYIGTEQAGATNIVAWQPADSSVQKSIRSRGDSLLMDILPFVNNNFPTSGSYWNIDKPFPPPSSETVFLNFTTDTPGVQIFTVYAIGNGRQVNAPIALDANTGRLTIYGMAQHLVVIGLRDGYLYGGIKSITPNASATYSMHLSKTDASTFKTMVNALR
jgi:hypothetical protein